MEENYSDYNFEERLVVIKKWGSMRFECPNNSRVENLFLNNLGLVKINLNELSSLIEISVTHNKLTNTDFLRYSRNGNIKTMHVDYNEITDLYVPPKVKILTASFNKLTSDDIESLY